MNKKLTDKIDLILEEINELQAMLEFDEFDSSETSEINLDEVTNILAEIKARISNRDLEVEKIDLEDL